MSSNPSSPALRNLTPGIRQIVVTMMAGALLTGCGPNVTDPAPKPGLAKIPQTPGRQTPEDFPEVMGDPYEPINRAAWKVNEGILFGILQPTARVYRAVVPRPARVSVSNFSRNVSYPGRLLNNVLQGRWQGAGDESLRFLTNTTVGIGGLFDPATHWNIPKSNANFAQTFHKWGARPHAFIMLPGAGPNDDLHIAGAAMDKIPDPWNFFGVLSTVSIGTAFNNLSDSTETAGNFVKSESDPYVGTKYIWTYASNEGTPDWSTAPTRDLPTLQTLNVVTVGAKDPEFAWHGRESSVRIPATGRKMEYSVWLQKKPAPIVYVVPGLGTHRLSGPTLSLAELYYQNGCSVVTVTGTFHPEFMENASTVNLPAYPPADCHDLLVYLTEIDRKLDRHNPGKISSRALVGYSMGGFQALQIAARGTGDSGLLDFDRYIAINPPVDLTTSIRRLDSLQDAAKDWPADVRQQKINNTVFKAAAFPTLTPDQLANPPFDATESKFLVGLSFRLTLRDTIYNSQSRNDMGVIKTPLNDWRRDPAYDEILNYSFGDYFSSFAIPYYQSRGITLADFDREVNLRTYQKSLYTDSKIRVLANQDDPLISAGDISWLKSTFGPSRITLFPHGGHLGNLASPPVRESLLKAIDGL